MTKIIITALVCLPAGIAIGVFYGNRVLSVVNRIETKLKEVHELLQK
jgi:hypothetical protein